MPARNDRVAPPAPKDGYTLRFLRKSAADGWEDLCRQQPAATLRAYNQLSTRPCHPANDGRQHRLKLDLAYVKVNNVLLEQWQYEVTAAARVWYAVNSSNMTVWIAHAGTGHPSKTDT